MIVASGEFAQIISLLRNSLQRKNKHSVASAASHSLLRKIELTKDARSQLLRCELQIAFEHAFAKVIAGHKDPTALSQEEAVAVMFQEVLTLLMTIYPSQAANEALAATAISAGEDDGTVFDEVIEIFGNVARGEPAFGSDKARNEQVAVALGRVRARPILTSREIAR